MPEIRYFLYHKAHPVQKNHDIWNTSLPVNRIPSRDTAEGSVTHGDYFSAIRFFLEENGWKVIISAVSQCMCRPVLLAEIKEISICLEKHGEFYHPARIRIYMDDEKIPFVLNAAVSDAGRGCILREYYLLKQLNEDFPCTFLPKIYEQGYGQTLSGTEIPMFLGEWFDNYNEFHISHDPNDGKNKIRVWDAGRGPYFLSHEKTRELYRQAAMILTCYYNFETFEQIYPWHHGAGDFIVKYENDEIDLKLITVRQYTSLVEHQGAEPDPGAIPEALLLFLLNLSIRMRLDRMDGVGDIVWADDIAVQGTLEGFFQALSLRVPEAFVIYFRNYLSSHTETALLDLSESIVNACPPLIPEVPVMQKHLKKHTVNLRLFMATTSEVSETSEV
ncbi:hypothetical protein QUF80_15335 [Desulfococcaceae bacterium HSG8]|nr:hypothetical protein [Desulfococcaceae bacterium HSG8]